MRIKQYFACRNYRTDDCEELFEKDCPATCAYSRRILHEIENTPKEVTLNLEDLVLWGDKE